MIADFNDIIWEFYDKYGRHELPWRLPNTAGEFDPYRILVSEIMLQQTQVPRVLPKFETFLQLFPSVNVLAGASQADVLRAWQGLGYNRRAKFLYQTAQTVTANSGGNLPQTRAALQQLPGIGPGTAGAILVYAFNRPEVFIETNIRTVFIHHFFAGQQKVSDTAISQLVTQTLPSDNPREWYWALMDYGTHLKQTVGNLNRSSASYIRQSSFQGSRRQIRGQILRLLGERAMHKTELTTCINDGRLASVLEDLVKESLIVRDNHDVLRLAD